MNLEQLNQKYKELSLELREVEAAIYKIHRAAFIEKHNGIDIGDTIKFLDGKDENFGVVSKIDGTGSILNYCIFPLKKDGTPSRLQVRLVGNDMKTISLIKKADKS